MTIKNALEEHLRTLLKSDPATAADRFRDFVMDAIDDTLVDVGFEFDEATDEWLPPVTSR